MKLLLILLTLIDTKAFNICVVGGNSGLGRELIYQSINNDKKVIALTNKTKSIKYPYRGNGLTKKSVDKLICSKNLEIDTYDNSKKYEFENIVFTLGAGPLENDYSDIVTKNILKNVNHDLNFIILMSAYGVGDSLKESNIGIKLMDNIYLKDTYRAKNRQEEIVSKYAKKNSVNCFIIRPKGLSYGQNIYSIKSREKQAKEILELLYLG